MKVKITVTFFLTVFCFSTIPAQVAFNKNYQNTDGSGNWVAFNLIVKDSLFILNGGYSVLRDNCNSYWSRGTFFVAIDTIGDIVNKKHYSDCEKSIYEGSRRSIVISPDQNTIYSCGVVFYSDLNVSSDYFTIVDFNLDTVSFFEYNLDTTTKRVFSLCNTNDNCVVLAGSVDSSYNELVGLPETTYSKSYLCKLSTQGETIWAKSYSFADASDGCWSTFFNVECTYDKGYIVTGITSDFGNSRNLILKTDSLGNQQWVRFYGNFNYDNPAFSDIIATQDSCFLVCGSYTYGETFGGLYPYDGWLVKVDINGNTKWEKKYRDYVLNNTDWRDTINCKIIAITELNDNGFAGIAMGKSNQCLSEEFSIYRFDSIGNLLWKKLFTEFPECTIAYHPNTIIQTDDFGFAIGGHIDHYEWNSSTSSWDYSQRLFLIKTDSLGNDSLINDIAPLHTSPITDFKLICYPNPANNEFFIDLPQDFTDDTIEIYSTNGSLVYVQTVGYLDNRVDISNLKPGMYLVKLCKAGLYGKIIIE